MCVAAGTMLGVLAAAALGQPCFNPATSFAAGSEWCYDVDPSVCTTYYQQHNALFRMCIVTDGACTGAGSANLATMPTTCALPPMCYHELMAPGAAAREKCGRAL